MRVNFHIFEPSLLDDVREDRCAICGNKETQSTGAGHVDTQGEANTLNAVSRVRHCIEIEDLEAVDEGDLNRAYYWAKRNDPELYAVIEDENERRVDRAISLREAQWG